MVWFVIVFLLIRMDNRNGAMLPINGALLHLIELCGAPLRLSRDDMRSDAQKNYDHLLQVARAVIAEQGTKASLRDVARRAGVGIGTLYRHFPTREALLEALLRGSFDTVTAKAEAFAALGNADDALASWLREMVALTHSHQGLIASMTAAMEDENSALHASCVMLRASGARLLARAQAGGTARHDIDGTDLLALISALAWLNDQPAFSSRVEHLFAVVMGAIFKPPVSTDDRPRLA